MINCFTWVAPGGGTYGVVVQSGRTLNDWAWEAVIYLNGLACHRLNGTVSREEEIRAAVEGQLLAVHGELPACHESLRSD